MSIDRDEVARQHQTIGAREMANTQERTEHPDAQWFGNAGLGVFLQPGIVVNGRARGHGDFETPEGVFPKIRPDGWWEQCHCWVEGATGGPWPERCNVPVTCKADVWYLHVDWVWDGPVEIKEPTRRPKSLTLLCTGEAVPWTATAEGFTFELAPSRMSALGEVVKVEWGELVP